MDHGLADTVLKCSNRSAAQLQLSSLTLQSTLADSGQHASSAKLCSLVCGTVNSHPDQSFASKAYGNHQT